MIFVALLLSGAKQYLGAHPVTAGLLLAAFVVPYFASARILGERQFLYRALLPLVSAYRLRHPLGAQARIIGSVTASHPRLVTMRTIVGPARVVDMLAGDRLPRIC